MIKYYLVPSEINSDNLIECRHPKYVSKLKLNWAGMHIDEKSYYLIVVNSKQDEKLGQFVSNVDVLEVDNTSNSKSEVQDTLQISISQTDDAVETIGQLQEPTFVKEDISVGTD